MGKLIDPEVAWNLWSAILEQQGAGREISFWRARISHDMPFEQPEHNEMYFSRTAILAQDPQGNIKYWNRGARKMFRYSFNEAMGMPSHVLVPEEEVAARQELFQGVLAHGMAEYVSCQCLRKDGQRINVYGYVFPYSLPDGQRSIAAAVEEGGIITNPSSEVIRGESFSSL
ncbi:PAS domain-containing protein [Candidatus Woesearchaeota archaeon]|nr:PAS domain-containing protein [Candidatus Woesearchaeota archaeon]